MAKKTKLYLLPQPKEIVVQAGTFEVDADTLIILPATAGDEATFAAQQIKGEVKRATCLSPGIVKLFQPHRRTNAIFLLCGEAEAEAFGVPVSRIGPEPAHPDQAYRLTIAPEATVLYAESPTGLFYAVQTLRQLVRLHKRQLPALAIYDWPTLAYRGVLLDISRGKVPTIETLKELVEVLSSYKLNVLQLYTEHTFRFVRHPKIGAGCDSLTSEDVLALDKHCRQHHVEFMPNLQSFGHFERILELPEYSHLAESQMRWTLSPAKEESYALLDELYADMLPSFTSKTFNVNCDEPYDLGRGASAELAEEIGVGRVYLNHVLRLRELAAHYGRNIQIWGDVLLHYPELIKELPADVTLLDWRYEAADSYPTVKEFAKAGRTFWVCPGTSSWNSLFPRLANSNQNIRNFVRDGVAAGAQGMLNTDWGDYGHYQPLGLSWYGYLFGAEQAWTGGTTDVSDFEAKFGRLFFGPEHEQILSAMHKLDQTNMLPGVPLFNASGTIVALLEDPLKGEMIETLSPETVQEMEALAEEARAMFDALAPDHPQESTLREMAFVAKLTSYAARKVALSQEIKRGLRELPGDRDAGAAELARYVQALKELDAELDPLLAEFEGLWLARARRSGIEFSLRHFSRLRERFAAATAWLERQREALLRGEVVDTELATYDTEGYLILWQEMLQRLSQLNA